MAFVDDPVAVVDAPVGRRSRYRPERIDNAVQVLNIRPERGDEARPQDHRQRPVVHRGRDPYRVQLTPRCMVDRQGPIPAVVEHPEQRDGIRTGHVEVRQVAHFIRPIRRHREKRGIFDQLQRAERGYRIHRHVVILFVRGSHHHMQKA